MKDKKLIIFGSALLIWVIIVFAIVASMFLVGTTESHKKTNPIQKSVGNQSQEIKEELERAKVQRQAEEDLKATEEAKKLIAEREKEEAERKKIIADNIKKNQHKNNSPDINSTEEVASKQDTPESQAFIVHGKDTIKGNVVTLLTNDAIEGVTVKLYDKSGTFLRSAETNKTGMFELPSVYTEDVILRAYKKGFVSGVYKSFSSTDLKSHVLLKLDPGQIIKGRVIDKLTNAPIRLVSVQLYKGISLIEGGITTDTAGEFSVEGVPEGKIDLAMQKKGYSDSNTTLNIIGQQRDQLVIPMERAFQVTIELKTPGKFVPVPRIRVYFDDAKTSLLYDRSILTADQGKNIFHINGLSKMYSKVRLHATGYEFTENESIAMKPGENTLVTFELKEGFAVTGIVRDEAQKPVVGIPVNVYEVFGGGRAIGDDVFKGEFFTDEKGNFKATGIKAGNVEFIIENTIYKKYKTKKVIHEDIQEFVEINLEIESFFHGSLKSKSGSIPIANEVRFIPIHPGGKVDGSRPIPKYSGGATTEGFDVSGVLPGLYRLTITANGYKAFIKEEYEVLENQSSGVFELENGHSITGKVSVQGNSNLAIGNAEIHFVTMVEGSNVKHTTKTDVHGFFAIEGLEVGQVYRCQADAIGYQFKTFERTIDQDTKEILIELEAKKTFSGIVVDAISKTPVTQFSVKIFGKIGTGLVASNNQTFSSSNGQFNIPVNEDKFSIEITAPNYGYLRVADIFVTDPIRNYYLPKGAKLEVTVFENQKPSSMKSVILSETPDPLPTSSWNYITNTEGKVLIPNLREGLYYLRVRTNGKAISNEVVQLIPEVENKKEIHLIPGFTLVGRVLNKETNFPVSSGMVWLDQEIYSDRPIRSRLSKDGIFRIQNVAPGPHILKFEHGQMIKLDTYSQEFIKNIEVPNRVDNLDGVYTMETIYIEK